MSIHDARPGPEWYWIYDKNREKWIDRRKYTFDKVTNTFVADYSYRLKWIQWILLLLITAAIIVGIIFGVKSANNKDDNNGGIKIIPAELADEQGYELVYPDGYIDGFGVVEINPLNTTYKDYILPIESPTGLKNNEKYTFTVVAKEGFSFQGGLKEIQIEVFSLLNQKIFRPVPPSEDILNVYPLGVTSRAGYATNNPTHQPGLLHSGDVWQMILPDGGWKWKECSDSRIWIDVKADADIITQEADGSELKIVRCTGNTQIEFVQKDIGRYVMESNPNMHKPLKFITVNPVTTIENQTQSFLNMKLPADDAKMGNDIIQSMNQLWNKGLIDKSLLAWIYIGLAGIKTESYHFNGVDPTLTIKLNEPPLPTEQTLIKFYESDITLNTSRERIPKDWWESGPPTINVCNVTDPIDDQYWINESTANGTPKTDFRTIFATDEEQTKSNLPTIRVFQKQSDKHYNWATAVDAKPSGTFDGYKYYIENKVPKIYKSSGGSAIEVDHTADSFWLCQIRSRPNSVIIPRWWPDQYKANGLYELTDRYSNYILQYKVDDSKDIIEAVNSISNDKGGVYFPYVSEHWVGNGSLDAQALKVKAIVSLMHWLYPSILLTKTSVPTYQEFTKYIPNKMEQYWTQGMKDTFDEINTASINVKDPANVTSIEFDEIWKPFEKLWFNLVHPESNGARVFSPANLKDLVQDGNLPSGSGSHPYYWGLDSSKVDQLGPIGRINALLDSLLSQDAGKINRFGTPITYDTTKDSKPVTLQTSLFGNDGFIDLKNSTPIELGFIRIKFEKNVVDFNSNALYKNLMNDKWISALSSNPSPDTLQESAIEVFHFLNSMKGKQKTELIHYLPWNSNKPLGYYPAGLLNFLSRAVLEKYNDFNPQNTYNALLDNNNYSTDPNLSSLKDASYTEFEKHDVVSSINTLILALLNYEWDSKKLGEIIYGNIAARNIHDDKNYLPPTTFEQFVERIKAFMHEGELHPDMVDGTPGQELKNHGTLPDIYTEWPAPLGTTLPWTPQV